MRLDDKKAFDRANVDFVRSNADFTFAFDYDVEMDFARYLARLEEIRVGLGLSEGQVPSSYLVATVGDEIVGRVSLRHELNDSLRIRGGHIGYGVVESWRGQGIASAILGHTLGIARKMGLKEVMLSCSDDNPGSFKVIEKCGGTLERVFEYEGALVRNYWIHLSD
ncbi:MAG: GNAT family N-acetyltransferase [Proteobacteria bacterium]|nr:MAG: GNAT family N-acetyltransferase [Pseudomonadota bacterium]